MSSSYGYADIAPPLSDEGAQAPAEQTAVVVAERTPVPDDSDSLTKITVAKMCEYIRSSAADPHVIGAAQYAAQRFGRGVNDPASFAWGVFWFLKHRVRRVLDEGNMFRVGEQGASDLLIAPSVLLRMANPAEDCDGFTMAAAAMLQALGVNQCIATVACDPREPERWSHVFGMVQLSNGEWMPLDCSHGAVPGWMVPRERISRWQCWDLQGNPIDVAPPVRSHLRGYRRRGMGQCDPSVDPTCGLDTLTPIPGTQLDPTTLPGQLSTVPVSSSPGFNWSQFLSAAVPALAADATRVASIAELPYGSSLTPSGAVIGGPYGGFNLGSIMPLLLLGLGAVLVINVLESKR